MWENGWPGHYNLDKTLLISAAFAVVTNAKRSCFTYSPSEGGAVGIQRMNRCRYSFGTVKANTIDAAMRVLPTPRMPVSMSLVKFLELIGILSPTGR